MDQIKIGRFIAERRKQMGLTQLQLSEMLGITDRAVSKWETGKSMPDASLMLSLCELLDISVNELLSGEIAHADAPRVDTDAILLKMAQELEEKNKIIWRSMWVIMLVSITALFGGIIVSATLVPTGVWQLVAIIAIVVVFLIPCFYALKLEVSVGVYKCKKCGTELEPSYNDALWAAHYGTTRYLKCPKCKKRTWCKKVIKK